MFTMIIMINGRMGEMENINDTTQGRTILTTSGLLTEEERGGYDDATNIDVDDQVKVLL
jgi:hypothetical protein